MRILTLIVRHGTTKYGDAASAIQAYLKKQLPTITSDLVVIDNGLPVGYQEQGQSNYVVIGGSNSDWEFSAWDDGLSYIKGHLEDYDFVNLATDAFQTMYTAYLSRISSDMLSLVANRAAAVGHVDYYNAPVKLFNRTSQSWLRTSFVMIKPTELRILGSLVSVPYRPGLFTDDPASPFAKDSPLSPLYQKYLLDWLTGEGTGQGVTWHSQFALSDETMTVFRRKVVAILNEHMFSVRLRAQGCAVVDATWLASQANQLLPAGKTLGAFPDWRQQLTERDTDPAPKSILS